MAYGLSLARRGVRHPASGKLVASLCQDEHGAGTANIHAGSALLATGGICMLGDLSGFRKDKLDDIQSGRPNLRFVKMPSLEITSLACQFWTAARCPCSSPARSMAKMSTSSFTFQSCAASGPSQTPPTRLGALGRRTTPPWERR